MSNPNEIVIKSFNISCDYNGTKQNTPFYIGYPEPTHHPIHFQTAYISKQRGGTVPGNVLDALSKLLTLAIDNNLEFAELAEYAIKQSEEKKKNENVEPNAGTKKDNDNQEESEGSDESETSDTSE